MLATIEPFFFCNSCFIQIKLRPFWRSTFTDENHSVKSSIVSSSGKGFVYKANKGLGSTYGHVGKNMNINNLGLV